MAIPRPVYNKSVALQSPGGTQSATTGERTTTWTTVATVWADISPLSVRDMLAAGQMQSEVSHRVKMRYSSTIAAIDASWRVLYGSRVLVISGVRNLEEDSRVIELICGEGMREE